MSGRQFNPSRQPTGVAGRGFSLIELLVVIAVIAMVLSLLMPALSRSIGMARQFRCQVSLRSVGFDFGVFADDTLHGDRGEDERLAPRFKLETFQESEYGIDEFWRWGDKPSHKLPDEADNNPMRCAAVEGFLTLRRGAPCRSGGVGPSENVSYTFNGRLDRAPLRGSDGSRWMQTTITDGVVSEPRIPLAWDVDGETAAQRRVSPVFSAPSLDVTKGPFANSALWFPAMRHNGSLNVLFTDQSVEASTDPLGESQWKWGFLPR
jgi:prepilin-type N-terminal cleavage/methylation domain-containing protein/prepilin-type processing-associated H-X9-DG protein